MNPTEEMEQMRRLALVCWDGYLHVMARQEAMMELLSGLLTRATEA